MTQGAGQAAMIALQRHNQQNQTQPRQGAGTKQPVRRTNSLTAATNRSSSMRSYTYHPKPSYTVGQPLGSSNQGARRFNSLNSKSSVGSFHRPGARTNSLTSLNSFVRSRSPPVLYEQDDEGEEDGDFTVTTKTTKVVDSQGRVLSITVETIKTFADGSTVTNTTTKNISRSNSRANSLNSQSMALKGAGSGKHNSMLSNGAGGSYNLSKIDEDLQDFDYNYELDRDTLAQKGRGHPQVDNAMSDLIHDENLYGQGLRLNHGNRGSASHGDEFESPELHAYGGGNESINSAGLKSITSESSKPLKSILKKKNNISDKGTEDEEGFADAVNELETSKVGVKQDESQHPYKSLGSPQINEPPKFKVPKPQNMQAPKQPNRINTSTGGQRTHSLVSSPASRYDDVLSNRSEASNSIKFLEKHETIPIFYNDKPKETEPSKPSDQDLYNIAMQVAMEKVYGNKERQQSPKLEGQRTMSLNSHTSPIQDPKRERKTQELNEQGVNDNYVYQNHHKDFVGLSLRDNVEPKQTSRKERAKEERKQHKSEIKEHKQKIKEKEKEEAENLKASSKEQKKAQKAQKHGRLASLFRRKSISDNSNSNFVSDEVMNKYETDNNSTPINSNSNPVQDHASVSNKEAGYQKLDQKNLNSEDSLAKKVTTGFTTFNPEMQRRLMATNRQSTEKEHLVINDLSNTVHKQNYTNYDSYRNLNSNQKDDNNGIYDSNPSAGYTSNYDNSFNNAPSRPALNNENSVSYSMRFPRNANTKADTENLTDLSNDRGSTGVNLYSTQNQNTEDSNAGQPSFQDMPGSMPGVDSSILRAIVKDDSEASPLFNQAVSTEENSVLYPSPNLMNDLSAVDSIDRDEKRKGKVLDPITVPVLNEIKSETTSIESPSNQYRDVGAELDSGKIDNPDELLHSDAHEYLDPPVNALNEDKYGEKVCDDVMEGKKDNSSQTLRDSFSNEEILKPNVAPQTSNELADEAVLVNENDVKGYGDPNALSEGLNTSSVSKNYRHQPTISSFENQSNMYPAMANNKSLTLNMKYNNSEELDHVPGYEKRAGNIDLPSQAEQTFGTESKDADVFPTVANTSRDMVLNNNETINSQSHNLQAAAPIHDGFNDGVIPDTIGHENNHDQLQSTKLPQSSFEHMQREESDSPVVIHSDKDVNESKPSKKGNKFKQKLFKYFVNSYSN